MKDVQFNKAFRWYCCKKYFLKVGFISMKIVAVDFVTLLQTTHHFNLWSENFFMSNSIKFCIKQALNFKIWVIFDKAMGVYSQKFTKESSFWCHIRYVSFLLGRVYYADFTGKINPALILPVKQIYPYSTSRSYILQVK